MTYLHTQLAEISLTLDEGCTERLRCPACNRRNTFTVTKTNGVLVYNCYSASCSLRGAKSYTRDLNSLKNKVRKPTQENIPFVLPEHIVYGIANDKCLNYLKDTQAYNAYKQGLYKIGYDPRMDRLLFFIENEGRIVGAEGRTLRGDTPKSYVYPNSHTVPFIARNGNTAVLVEDCTSAASIAQFKGIAGVALRGTNIPENYLTFLKSFDRLIIALDKDASKKSIKMQKYLQFFCKDVSIAFLEKDLKNHTHNELVEWVNGR